MSYRARHYDDTARTYGRGSGYSFFCFVASFYGHCLCACWWAELQVEPELEAEAELRVRLAEQEEDSGGSQGRVEQHWQGSQHLEGRRLRE